MSLLFFQKVQMKLFSKRYREVFAKKAEEEKSADEIYEDQFEAAQERIEDAHEAVQALKREYIQMDEKHQLSLNGFTLTVGKRSGAPGEVDAVLAWWKDFCGRTNLAQIEFNAALACYSALKKPEVSVHHLDGSENQRHYRVVK